MRPPFARTLHDLLDEQAALRPDALAAICAGQPMTYAALAGRARKMAAALRVHGLRHGERVGILMNNRTEWVGPRFRNGWASNLLLTLTLLTFAGLGALQLAGWMPGGGG